MTTEPETKERKLLAVFAGYRLNEPYGQTPKQIAVWYELSPDGDTTDKRMSFTVTAKKMSLTGKGVLVGDVFEMTECGEGSYSTGPNRRQHRAATHPKASEWRMEEDAALAGLKAYKAAKNVEYGKMTLDECRKLYRKTIGRKARMAMLLNVQQFMTG